MTRKKAKPATPHWTEDELAWVKRACSEGRKATEIAASFVKQFRTHSFPAVEHRVYKLRREGNAAPRNSEVVETDLKLVRGAGAGTGASSSYVLTLPNGGKFIGTRQQLLDLLHRTA